MPESRGWKITTEQKDLTACLFDPLSFVSICVFFQADARLKALLRSFSGFQKKRTTFSVLGADRGGPGLEIILGIGKILPMVLRHMRSYHDWIPLTADLSWMDSYPVSVKKYLHCIACYANADGFADQVHTEPNTCLIRL